MSLPSRSKRKKKTKDFGKQNLHWIEQQQLEKALSLSLKKSSKEEKKNSFSTLESKSITGISKDSNNLHFRLTANCGESERKNCLVPNTKVRRKINTRIGDDSKTCFAQTSSKSNSDKSESISSDLNLKKSINLTISKLRPVRKFAVGNIKKPDDLIPQSNNIPCSDEIKYLTNVEPAKNKPQRNIIFNLSPDTTEFLTWLCFRGTKYEPDLT